jgi:hypothetical protein
MPASASPVTRSNSFADRALEIDGPLPVNTDGALVARHVHEIMLPPRGQHAREAHAFGMDGAGAVISTHRSTPRLSPVA